MQEEVKYGDQLDRIYFGNIEINLRDNISYSDLNDEEDEDCESDKENIDSTTSNIGVECYKNMGTILKRQRSREIITGISVKKAKTILQTYHRIKEWEVNLFICYMKISRQKYVGYMWGYDAIEIYVFKSNFIIMHNV